MARAYDIAERLQTANKRSTVTIDKDHVYNINTSKNTAILIQAISQDEKLSEIERIDKVIEAGIGEDAINYINSLNLTMEATTLILNVIMAAISDVSLEEAEEEAKKAAMDFRKGKRK
ncbi:hypothetical protein [Clostridium polynesiense]|uniref:hypothetical protein n=1 Tax=Clostridium polynesiense TaxID=1325933 RepID=UPI00058DE8E9|nr:hypothetical protein [Clostridium polynesiense]